MRRAGFERVFQRVLHGLDGSRWKQLLRRCLRARVHWTCVELICLQCEALQLRMMSEVRMRCNGSVPWLLPRDGLLHQHPPDLLCMLLTGDGFVEHEHIANLLLQQCFCIVQRVGVRWSLGAAHSGHDRSERERERERERNGRLRMQKQSSRSMSNHRAPCNTVLEAASASDRIHD